MEFITFDEAVNSSRPDLIPQVRSEVADVLTRLAVAQERICRSNASDIADTVVCTSQQGRVLTRAVLSEMRERMLQVSARPKPWHMEVYKIPDDTGIRLEAHCWRATPQAGGCETYTSYRLDFLKSRSTGTICYIPGSNEPINGDPREEFETQALKELAKDHELQKWPPF